MINFRRQYLLNVTLILVVLSLIGIAGFFWYQQKTAALPEVSVSYFSDSELSYQRINIRQSELTYNYFEDPTGECARWLYQFPCWLDKKEGFETKKVALSKREIKDLIKLIKQTKFLELEEFYGESGEGRRYYPIEISVKLGEKERKVIYRSSLDAPLMPEAFERVEDKLFELIKEKFGL